MGGCAAVEGLELVNWHGVRAVGPRLMTGRALRAVVAALDGRFGMESGSWVPACAGMTGWVGAGLEPAPMCRGARGLLS